MATTVRLLDLDEAAKQAAANWKRFDSFCWHRATDLANPDDWTILYTHHRDSGLLDQSNASIIAKALAAFTEGDDPDVVAERHDHWACGWIDGFAVRVFRNGRICDSYRTYYELAQRMDNYPILNESDYSQREYDATLRNIEQAAWRLMREFDLPDAWASEVFSWFWEHNQSAVENVDDQGGWPDENALEETFLALDYPRAP